MKLVMMLLLGAAVLASASPVARVVQLLSGLRGKLETDAKAEKDIFERFECWYKTVVDTKTASNLAAQSRIDSLNQYVADVEAGKIEFTTERADLENQVAGLTRDTKTARALRENEKKDFAAAEEEMEQAIAALGQAIEVIEKGTAFTQTDSRIQQPPQLLNVKWSLRKVLEFGRGILSAKDARFLEHALDGDVPTPDWKKLNRKATFKTKYSARSTKIQEVLKSMEQTFTENLEAARAKEAQSNKTFEALMQAKGEMLQAAEDALVSLVEENGARGLSKEQALAEVTKLGEQMTADNNFISETEATYTEKSKEFEDRRALRMSEIQAIGEAISVLHSDDARDAFKKSYKSYLFLQKKLKGCPAQVAHTVRDLWSLASSTRSAPLALLAATASAGRFDKVLEMIDKMVLQLQGEEATDLEKKELGETERAENTREAVKESRSIDGLTDEIEKASETVQSIKKQITEQDEVIKGLEEQKASITRQREDEHAQFNSGVKDDEDAVALIQEAMLILTKFYADNGLSLLRVHEATGHSHAAATVQRPAVEAGKAPPPPPATWASPSYGGAGDEQAGISGILSILKEDIERDIASAKSSEAAAKAAFDQQAADLDAAVASGEAAIVDYNGQKATAETLVQDKTTERAAGKGSLDSIMLELKRNQPGCDFFTVNFASRTKKRQTEIDGLKQAKAILSSSNTEALLQLRGKVRC